MPSGRWISKFLLSKTGSSRACSDCLAFTELTRLGELKCLYGEKFAQVGECPYHHIGVTRAGWAGLQELFMKIGVRNILLYKKNTKNKKDTLVK